jgi:hypothetical protein
MTREPLGELNVVVATFACQSRFPKVGQALCMLARPPHAVRERRLRAQLVLHYGRHGRFANASGELTGGGWIDRPSLQGYFEFSGLITRPNS